MTDVTQVRKTVTVVFADVTGSTELGERLDPESLRRVMRRYFEEARSALEGHGGTVEKFIGDAVMAVFGIPQLHEDDALRAVRAAAEIRDRLAALNDELERDWGVRLALRIGVNTGEVVAGDASAGESFVTGDAVNVAARLEQAADPDEIIVGADTYRLVRDAVDVEVLDPLALKGKSGRAAGFRLLAVQPGAAGHARRLDAPMVGRERELALLEHTYERSVRERTCHLFTVLGSAGIGKSRLVREFVARVGDDALVLAGRCLPYGEGITYWPVSEAVKERAAVQDEHSPAEARTRIATLLAGEDDCELVATKLAAAIGLGEGGVATEEASWAVRRLFESLAQRQALVVVFDDIQWGEETFLELIEHVVDYSREAPILLVCLARPELLDVRPGWAGGKLNATSVLLDQLPDDECRVLIQRLLGEAALPAEARGRIADWAGGNPLFVEEMLAMLLEEGVLARDNGRWAVTGDLAAVSVPATIQALLAARLDRLPVEERRVIERGAVEGEVFHSDAVAALLDGAPLAGELASLVRKEVVRRARPALGTDGYRFRHLLIRDAAYAGIPKEVRAELHARFAAWLERAAGQRIAEYEEIVGYHLEQAHRYRTQLAPADDAARALARAAARHLAAAGRRAAARGDAPAAAKLLDRATALLPEDDEQRLELALRLAGTLVQLGDLTRADRLVQEVAAQAATRGDRRLELHARLSSLSMAQLTRPEGISEQMEALAAEAVPVFEAAGDELGLARAWNSLADARNMRCRYGATAEALERALVHAERAGDLALRSEILSWLPTRLHRGPMPVSEALPRCRDLLRLASGDRLAEAGALAGVALLEAISGNFGEARELMRSSQAIKEELGVRLPLAIGWIFSTELELAAGDAVAAEAAARRAYELLGMSGEKSFFSSAAAAVGQALYERGRLEEAERLTYEAEEAAASDDMMTQMLWRSVRAAVLADRGRRQEAEELARSAVQLGRETEDTSAFAQTLLFLARVLARDGRAGETRAVLEEALAVAQRKEHVVFARRAREQLAALA